MLTSLMYNRHLPQKLTQEAYPLGSGTRKVYDTDSMQSHGKNGPVLLTGMNWFLFEVSAVAEIQTDDSLQSYHVKERPDWHRDIS